VKAIVRLAGAQVGLSDCGLRVHPKVRSFRHWAAANCAAPPIASAGQYATSNCCKPLLFGLPCKWRYTYVGTFNLWFFFFTNSQWYIDGTGFAALGHVPIDCLIFLAVSEPR